VALLTALAILLTSFMHPPVHAPGISISKADATDTDSPIAERMSRDAEEDAGDDHEPEVSGTAIPTAMLSLAVPAGFGRGGLPPRAAWPPTGRPRGPHAVRGPPGCS